MEATRCFETSVSTYEPTRRHKQDRQCTYNVILRRVRELLLPWKSDKNYIFVCVCVYVRVRADARERGLVHAHAFMWSCLSSIQRVYAIL